MENARTAKALGEAILQARKARGLSQEKLAQLADMSREGLRRIEAGESTEPRKLPNILAALDMEMDELMGEPPHPEQAREAKLRQAVRAILDLELPADVERELIDQLYSRTASTHEGASVVDFTARQREDTKRRREEELRRMPHAADNPAGEDEDF